MLFHKKGADIVLGGFLNDRNLDFYYRNYTEMFSEHVKSLGLNVIIYAIEGSVTVYTKSQTFNITAGQMLFIPSETTNVTYHFWGSPIHRSFSFGFRFFPNINPHDYQSQIIEANTELHTLANNIPIYNYNTCEKTWKFYRFLTYFQKFLFSTKNKNSLKIQKALEIMNHKNIYSATDLAKICKMDRSRFHTVFKEVTGRTFIKEKHRIQAFKAEVLLRSTDMSIEEISKTVGFSSVRHFRKVFKERYNCTPKKIKMFINPK